MISYTWAVASVDRYPSKDKLPDVVLNVHWTLRGTDGARSAETSGCTTLPAPDSKDFVPFGKLDETTVLGWVKSVLDTPRPAREGEPPRESGTVASYEAIVTELIERQTSPSLISSAL